MIGGAILLLAAGLWGFCAAVEKRAAEIHCLRYPAAGDCLGRIIEQINNISLGIIDLIFTLPTGNPTLRRILKATNDIDISYLIAMSRAVAGFYPA